MSSRERSEVVEEALSMIAKLQWLEETGRRTDFELRQGLSTSGI